MASGSQNMTTYLAKGLQKILTTNAINTDNLLYINTADTNITADMLGATTSIAFTRASITGAYTTGHMVWLNAADIGTPFQLVVHDSSDLYLYKRWKSSGAWTDWTKMSAGHADTAAALESNAGETEQPIYFTGGKPAATSYALKATVNNGDTNYVAYYSGARAISSSKAATTMIMPAHYYHNLYNNNPTTGTTVYVHYYNGDTTSTNTFANLRVKSGTSFKVLAFGGDGALSWGGTMTANGGYLKSTANGNTVTIGSQNTGFAHIQSSANIPFYFNRTTLIDGDLGNTSYPIKNITIGKANGAGIYYQGSKANYRMIRFIDNTEDNYGNGISIGGGGQTIIGGGESADTAAAQVGTAGSEIMYVCNDGNVDIISNLQNGWSDRKVMTLNTSGYLMLSSYINVPTSNNENPTVSQFIVTNGSDNYYRKASTAHVMAAIRGSASGSWGISITGNAATATKATQDQNGNNIASTYLKMNTAGGIASVEGGGQYWVARICTIKITSAYINRPIVLEISGRDRQLSLVQIIFQSINGTDPGLSSFVSNYGKWFYIKKTTTSTWEVYAHYSESWGSFCLHRITGMGANIGVTVNMDNYSTSNAMPSGATQVSYGGNVDYANSANYTSHLLGVNTSNSPYGYSEGNIIRAVWNVEGDSRWYFRAGSYQCRVDYANSAGSVAWNNVTGKPSTFAPATHNHDSSYVNITGDTMSGALTVSSTGNNRATVYIRSAGDVPMDLYLGSKNTNYWSISCRESANPYLGFYWAGSSGGWALLMHTNKHVEIPVHAYVGGYNNTSYALSTNSFICNSWIRSVGSTGWYNETHGGGWYMTDNIWIRAYNNKAVYVSNTTDNSIETLGGVCAHQANGFRIVYGSRAFIIRNDGSNTYFMPGSNANTSGNNWASYYSYVENGNGYWHFVRAYGAVWNDYAEYRVAETIEPGRVVQDTIDGRMILVNERLSSACKVVSDTYGFAIGETDQAKTPIAVSGRVLVYPYQAREKYEIGMAVCSAPNGTVDIMSREEIMTYPERIIGTVSEIPNYDVWEQKRSDVSGNNDPYIHRVPVHGRIWIYVR